MRKIIFIFAAIIFIMPSLVLADGMIMPPPDRYMYESDQKAVIFHENGIETMVLSISFKGNADNFAWLIPTPKKPEVTKSSDELFTSLDELTRLSYDLERPTYLGTGLREANVPQKVTILETKKIDYYDIVVLESTDAQELVNWLNVNGYQFPENQIYLLTEYINNGWVFTTVKIDSSALSWQVQNQLKEGHATPLRLEFATDKIIYPMKVSSIVADYEPPIYPRGNYRVPNSRYYSPPDYVNILLYVIADHKQTIPGFSTQYAGSIKKDVIEKLAYNDDGSPWIEVDKGKYYLTKLTRQMQRSEMTHDLVLRQADNDDNINAPNDVEQSWTPFIIITTIGGLSTLILIIVLAWQASKKD